jgi:uncharacterized Rossmann fold enzyme
MTDSVLPRLRDTGTLEPVLRQQIKNDYFLGFVDGFRAVLVAVTFFCSVFFASAFFGSVFLISGFFFSSTMRVSRPGHENDTSDTGMITNYRYCSLPGVW